ncbi:four helix bundle protein [Adhaeribacter rhizoryzae]|uniref:Four helix bundle protein n=1 Tax=Adhaeribacter rhizoryzae TaxID=2607907 RepID=A0A5M6DJR0_9BACT|nr:four helix bundle protein [Adhaeribacter rhizoryzae]KAA5547784.1 four helix bundle protein [Adhaeribacter rhizoryzae]
MQNYKSLKVWQDAYQLTLHVYQKSKSFPKEEIYGLTSQIRRACISIPNNIAEGCGRNTNLDFAHFLQISLGSTNEVDYLNLLAKDLGYLSFEEYLELDEQLNKIRAKLINLIQQVRKNKNVER